MVTDTGDVARAIDLAQREWPGLSRSKALARLVREGAAAVGEARAARPGCDLVDALSSFAGIFPDGYLDDLRKDWPA